MSNAETKAHFASQTATNALKRIETLESGFQQLASAVNNGVSQLQQQFANYVQIVDALVDLLGEDVVTEKVKANNLARLNEESRRNQEQIKMLLDQGVLVPAETVGERSLLVGRETKPDGEVVPPGRQQVLFSNVMPTVQEKIKGQSVGFKIDTPAGYTFELVEIYDITEKKPEMPPASEAVVNTTAEEAQVS